MKLKWILIIFSAVVGISIFLFASSIFLNTVGEAVEVAHDEVGPRALNNKYEWFKNAYASLDQKRAQIEVMQSEIDNFEAVDRFDRQHINLRRTELTGLKGSYNLLAAEYNSEMSKFHTRFLNAGMLPKGGDGSLPREVATYLSK